MSKSFKTAKGKIILSGKMIAIGRLKPTKRFGGVEFPGPLIAPGNLETGNGDYPGPLGKARSKAKGKGDYPGPLNKPEKEDLIFGDYLGPLGKSIELKKMKSLGSGRKLRTATLRLRDDLKTDKK